MLPGLVNDSFKMEKWPVDMANHQLTITIDTVGNFFLMDIQERDDLNIT